MLQQRARAYKLWSFMHDIVYFRIGPAKNEENWYSRLFSDTKNICSVDRALFVRQSVLCQLRGQLNLLRCQPKPTAALLRRWVTRSVLSGFSVSKAKRLQNITSITH